MTTRLQPLTNRGLVLRSETFAQLLERRMRAVVRETLPFLDETITATGTLREYNELRRLAHPILLAAVSPDDLNPMRTQWSRVVDDELLSQLTDEFFVGMAATSRQLASAGFLRPLIDEAAAAQSYLQTARNRLVAIGDTLWSDARNSLVEGMRLGEGVPALADRVRDSVNVAMPRATTIARTEVISATNAGSIEEMRASGLVTQKEWIATLDDRTRETHVEADRQTVNLGDRFTVGDWPLDFPGDPTGPPEEVINCRCTMAYNVESDITETRESDDFTTAATQNVLLAAAGDHGSGCMIALIPTREDAERLAIDDGEPAEELHVTLAYLGKTGIEVDDDVIRDIRAIATQTADEWRGGDIIDYDGKGLLGRIGGVGTLGDEDAAVAFFNGDALDAIHSQVQERMDDSDVVYRTQFRPWIAHLTLGYGNDPGELDLIGEEITFDRLRVAIGDEVYDYELCDTIAASVVAEANSYAMAHRRESRWVPKF